MQRNDLILPVAVSLLHETVANIEALKIHPVPNGHLARFMNMLQHSGVKDELRFQGITLRGSLDGKPKRGDVRTGSFQSRVNEAIGLCLTGLEERFGSLMNSASNSESTTKYGTADVINDLLVFMLMLGQKAQRNWWILAMRKLNALLTGFNHYCRGLDVMFLPFPKSASLLRFSSILALETRTMPVCGRPCSSRRPTRMTSKMFSILWKSSLFSQFLPRSVKG